MAVQFEHATAGAALGGTGERPRLLFLVTEDWYFWSHRLSLARAARDAGWEVLVATRVDGHGERIRAEGFRLIPIRLRRGGRNPLTEVLAIADLVRLYWRERPQLVHHVAVKPTLYGSLAALLTRVPAVVNALAGMGWVFASSNWKARLLRPLLVAAFRLLLDRRDHVLIVQNDDDHALFADGIVAPERLACIRGSGVDVAALVPTPEPEGVPVAALVARMLWDKGAGDAVTAARILAGRNVAVRVVLVGKPDPDNPGSIPESTLRTWHQDGVVEWWGHTEDIAGVWARAHMAILPTTYREGLPKTLLEAAACGRPLIATDTPGCRDFIRPGINGLLVPPGDAEALADAIEHLARTPERRLALGQGARRLVEAGFSDQIVTRQIIDIYRRLSGGGVPRGALGTTAGTP